jgi:hypothetical protein
LTRLSITHITATVPPPATPERRAKLLPATSLTRGRLRADVHERRLLVAFRECLEQLRRRIGSLAYGLYSDVYAACEGPGVRHEREVRLDAGGGRGQRGDLGRVPVRERAVGVKIPMPLRVMRARCRLATGSRAAGDARDEQPGLNETLRQQRHARESTAVAKQPGCATWGVARSDACSGTAQLNSAMRTGAACPCL